MGVYQCIRLALGMGPYPVPYSVITREQLTIDTNRGPVGYWGVPWYTVTGDID
jgi:hypothetical protein